MCEAAEQKIQRDHNFSTALVKAALAKSTLACGHKCSPIKLSTHWTWSNNTTATYSWGTYSISGLFWYEENLSWKCLLWNYSSYYYIIKNSKKNSPIWTFFKKKEKKKKINTCRYIYHFELSYKIKLFHSKIAPLSLCVDLSVILSVCLCCAHTHRGHILPVFAAISSGLTDTLPAAFISSRLAVWLNITSLVCLYMPQFSWTDFSIRNQKVMIM